MNVFIALVAISIFTLAFIGAKAPLLMPKTEQAYKTIRELILQSKPDIDKRIAFLGDKYDCRDAAYIGQRSILDSVLYDPQKMKVDVAVVGREKPWGAIGAAPGRTHALVHINYDGEEFMFEPQSMTYSRREAYPNSILHIGGSVNQTKDENN